MIAFHIKGQPGGANLQIGLGPELFEGKKEGKNLKTPGRWRDWS
jgi:hypothetical protein